MCLFCVCLQSPAFHFRLCSFSCDFIFQVPLPLLLLRIATFHVMRAIVLVMCTVLGTQGRTPRYPRTTVYSGGPNITSKQFAWYWVWSWMYFVFFHLSSCLVLSSSINQEGEITTTKFYNWILRSHFSDPAKLFVWVQAKNQHGSASSHVVVYNTTDISKKDISHYINTIPFLSGDFNNIF